MRERIEFLDGQWRIVSHPGAGPLIVATVPLSLNDEGEPCMDRSLTPARVIIADDHELSRAGLRSLLTGERWLELVGEAGNGREALVLCRDLNPDLVLLDVRMPEMDGLAATRLIKQACPKISVLIITNHEHYDYLIAALKAGAAGYLLKDITRQELLSAVRRVLRGESILDGEIAAQALQRLAGEQMLYDGPTPERLTTREREVLSLLAQGMSNQTIATQLTLSVGTVKIHVEHIIAKLGVSDRTQAAVHAIKSGLFKGSTIR
jgi:DNA-binding NarL/FixJ family response regulator